MAVRKALRFDTSSIRRVDMLGQNRLDLRDSMMDNGHQRERIARTRKRRRTSFSMEHDSVALRRDNNTLHTEPRAARLLETMMFAAAR